MALYRLKGTKGNDYPYVYTNPDSGTIISHRDKAFVLGIEYPSDYEPDMNLREGNLQMQNKSPTGQSKPLLDGSFTG